MRAAGLDRRRLGRKSGDIMTALTLHGVEAADSLALARLDDDGAPAAVTSVISHGGAKTARSTPGAAAGAPAATLPSARISFDPALIRAWRGRRRMVATVPERTYRAAWPDRSAGRPARRAGAAAGGPSRRMGRNPAPAHR